MPPSLFPNPAFSLTPEAGRTEPRLWVRRMVIWREPGQVLRDVSLKRGLNIVWSPDPRNAETAMGHGGGKTTFCRLLRYCLGEDSFAPETQRRAIRTRFPTGLVGAEVVIDGRVWVVVRALGERRRDIVIENGSLDQPLEERISPTGIEPMREAITKATIGDATTLMPEALGESAWEAALAWCSRDQECRFGDHLEWRDRNSDSHSPVRGLSVEDRLMVVRALIGALSSDEIAAQKRGYEETRKVTANRSKLERLDWQIERLHAELAEALPEVGSLAAGTPLAATGFKTAASASLAKGLEFAWGVCDH